MTQIETMHHCMWLACYTLAPCVHVRCHQPLCWSVTIPQYLASSFTCVADMLHQHPQPLNRSMFCSSSLQSEVVRFLLLELKCGTVNLWWWWIPKTLQCLRFTGGMFFQYKRVSLSRSRSSISAVSIT